jgi:hypothetical protein
VTVELISEAYRQEQAALHATGRYGEAALQFGTVVAALLNLSGAGSLLDYGCGSRRSLLQAIKLSDEVVYEGYDPAVPDYSTQPLPAELVCCIDVLEHIEPELLDNVLDELGRLCDPLGLFTIHTGPAVKLLSDGRNAHLTQQGPHWWSRKLTKRFDLLGIAEYEFGFATVVRSRQSTATVANPSKLHSVLKLIAPSDRHIAKSKFGEA